VGKFLAVGARALRQLYRTRASRRGKFCARDHAIARVRKIFCLLRRFGASTGRPREGLRALNDRYFKLARGIARLLEMLSKIGTETA
jgi:hypothetical protein